MQRSKLLSRFISFDRAPERLALQHNPITRAVPLLNSGTALGKFRRSWEDYRGTAGFDEEEHALPIMNQRLQEDTTTHFFSDYELKVNPVLLNDVKQLRNTPEYVGMRSGRLFPRVGWVPIGGSWKFSYDWIEKRKQFKKRNVWHEKNMTPRWQRAPRVSPGGPRNRYEGKLKYSRVTLPKILWAIDNGRLNPNETITMWHLVEAEVVSEKEVCWPGFKLTAAMVENIPYPIHIELQRASQSAIKLIEEAGGSFTATFLTADAMYQEMHPEEYPVFPEQGLPDRRALESVATNPRERGFLSQWYEEEGKYAHPDAGRRLSHYARPPMDRDFPATYEEYERVKHHQNWHLKQPGTGTVLPFVSQHQIDMTKPATGKL